MLNVTYKQLHKQENLFYNMPLHKLPTLRKTVQFVGIEELDKLQRMLKHSKSALEEAISNDLDDKEKGCEKVWTFVIRMNKFLNRLNKEARIAAGMKERKEECHE